MIKVKISDFFSKILALFFSVFLMLTALMVLITVGYLCYRMINKDSIKTEDIKQLILTGEKYFIAPEKMGKNKNPFEDNLDAYYVEVIDFKEDYVKYIKPKTKIRLEYDTIIEPLSHFSYKYDIFDIKNRKLKNDD